MIAAYFLIGVIVARRVRINTFRKRKRIRAARDTRAGHCRDRYGNECRDGDHYSEVVGDLINAFFAIFLWPIPLLKWILQGLRWAALGGVRAAISSPPARILWEINKFYWEDPQERKARKVSK